jgi:hypothetical protein
LHSNFSLWCPQKSSVSVVHPLFTHPKPLAHILYNFPIRDNSGRT